MTTATAPNIRNIAIEGTFDDAQALVKKLFADEEFARAHNLAAINSINWIRIALQAAYYVAAALSLKKDKLSFSVPTGNFGDAFAGLVAKKMGAPIGNIIIATNVNDIVARAVTTGVYSRGDVHATLSPAMDIQVASNFERLIFESYNRDAGAVREFMQQFESTGTATIAPEALSKIRADFSAGRVHEAETVATMRIVQKQLGIQIDPHTAVGFTATRVAGETEDVVTLGTAHPAKFPDAVQMATALKPELPESMKWILSAPERCDTLPNDLTALRQYIDRKPSLH